MFDTSRFFSGNPRKDLLGRDGRLAPDEILNNRYQVLGVLSDIETGTVYLARDLQYPEHERYVAVKQLRRIEDDEHLRRLAVALFEREVNLLATLSHPAIPSVYDYFSIGNDRVYFAMEFINGKNLEAILNIHGHSIPIEMVIDWALALSDVLGYMHSHNPPIIFRDVKPNNIMIDQYGRVRLYDFSKARQFLAGQRGAIIVTDGYSAPEQYTGEASPASDIYGLGATLHHILTNDDPRQHSLFSFKDRPIRKANPNVSPELEAIVIKALAHEASDRYSSMVEMKAALSSLRP